MEHNDTYIDLHREQLVAVRQISDASGTSWCRVQNPADSVRYSIVPLTSDKINKLHLLPRTDLLAVCPQETNELRFASPTREMYKGAGGHKSSLSNDYLLNC